MLVGDNCMIAIQAELQNLENSIIKLKEENERYRLTIIAENDRLDRNTKLEKENAILREALEKAIQMLGWATETDREYETALMLKQALQRAGGGE